MNIIRLFHTIIHLKSIQIRYQLWYRIRRFWRRLFRFKYLLSIEKEAYPVKLKPFIPRHNSYYGYQFTFLNQTKSFQENNIDWNFSEYGKLWNYNLNYFDYLLQPGFDVKAGLTLIDNFIKNLNQNSIGLDPYPIALRSINWIKFLSQHSFFSPRQLREAAAPKARNILDINNSLYAQCKILINNIEYHLLGNHLLEDGFSLLYGAFFFKDVKLYRKASEIIILELNEQILDDGGHFELSPMYHQILLDRLLDCINLLQNNKRFEDQESLLDIMNEKATKMLQWINQMTFSNGDIPHFNDSTYDIAPSSQELFEYAKRLNLNLNLNLSLSSSGYRKFKNNNYECIVDVGQVGPDYIPGHAHADMLSFVLYIDNKLIIVDTGISTYEKNNQRQLERSTSSHNTVVIDGKNQSDIWGGFRVGKRAKTKVLQDEEFLLEAEHNGYKPVIHKRRFDFNQDGFTINDFLSNSNIRAQAFLHFHPDRKVIVNGGILIIDKKYSLELKNINGIQLEDYDYPQGYNMFLKAKRCKITFQSTMQTQIKTYED